MNFSKILGSNVNVIFELWSIKIVNNVAYETFYTNFLLTKVEEKMLERKLSKTNCNRNKRTYLL